MLECVTNRGMNGNEIVKHECGVKEGWIENYENIMSFVLQIGLKTFNPNMDFGLHLHYKLIQLLSQIPPNNPL